jgi:hypothetical protein
MSTLHQLSFCHLATRYESLNQNGNPLDPLASHIPWETLLTFVILSNIVGSHSSLFAAHDLLNVIEKG